MRLRIRITGHVQGVGFRYFVENLAHKHTIVGFVKNNHDGALEIDAEGMQTDVTNFLEEIKHGPEFARIDKCETIVEKELANYIAFSIE